jgi:TRAP-type C4-dicarboxylate transport system permease large subunit
VNEKVNIVNACGIVGTLVPAQGEWVDHVRLGLIIFAVVAAACEEIEHILDLVGITIGEEVAVSAEVQAKKSKQGVYIACASAVSSQTSHIEYVIPAD